MKNRQRINLNFDDIQMRMHHKPYSVSIDSTRIFKLRVIFVYGDNFTRHHYFTVLNFWKSIKLWTVIIVIIIFATALYELRRRAGIRRASFTSGCMEILSVAIYGGNIHCSHKWERIIFASAMMTLFFLFSIFLADFSMQSIVASTVEKIDTFEKIAEHEFPIYVGLQAKRDIESIRNLFRLVNAFNFDVFSHAICVSNVEQVTIYKHKLISCLFTFK